MSARKAPKVAAPRVNAVQRRHLLKRIDDAQRERNTALWAERADKSKEPAHIKKARAELHRARLIVQGYDDKISAKRERARFANSAAAKKCREAVLFSEPDEALRLVQKFERSAA